MPYPFSFFEFFFGSAKAEVMMVDRRGAVGGNIGGLTVAGLISGLIKLLVIAAAVIFFFMLVLGGIKWIMSGGDKAALQTARDHVVAAIVGLVVVFLAYFLINFVLFSFCRTKAEDGYIFFALTEEFS